MLNNYRVIHDKEWKWKFMTATICYIGCDLDLVYYSTQIIIVPDCLH